MDSVKFENETGIKLNNYNVGNQKIVCPRCKGQGGQGFEGKTLSVTVENNGIIWYCNRQNKCGFTGRYNTDENWRDYRTFNKVKKVYKKPKDNIKNIDGNALLKKFFSDRKISETTLQEWNVGYKVGKNNSVNIAFRYKDATNNLINVKYRNTDKKLFYQEANCEQIFYGLHMLEKTEKQDVLYIVEGEVDALSMWEAGFRNVLSIPSGGISLKSVGNLEKDADKFNFLLHSDELLSKCEKFVLACDYDEVGKATMQELSRRLGREKCFRVTFPAKENGSFYKDANEVLINLGKEVLFNCVENAEPFPIFDVHSVNDYADEVFKLYNGEVEPPFSTGFENLDEFMKVKLGDISVVTGIPNSGKSEMVDAIILNMARLHGWKFGMCSFENPPKYHIAKLLEKHIGAPFFGGSSYSNKISKIELNKGLEYLNDKIHFVRADNPDERPPNIDWIIDKAKVLVRRFGIKGFVIDPYNEIESTRPTNMMETEFISMVLSKIKRFAQTYECHVWIVAHPRKMNSIDGKVPIPALYDIASSAHWANKADLGWCLSRDRNNPSQPVELHVLKVRWKECGMAGNIAYFTWDRWSGRYKGLANVKEEETENNPRTNYYT